MGAMPCLVYVRTRRVSGACGRACMCACVRACAYVRMCVCVCVHPSCVCVRTDANPFCARARTHCRTHARTHGALSRAGSRTVLCLLQSLHSTVATVATNSGGIGCAFFLKKSVGGALVRRLAGWGYDLGPVHPPGALLFDQTIAAKLGRGEGPDGHSRHFFLANKTKVSGPLCFPVALANAAAGGGPVTENQRNIMFHKIFF